MGDKQVKWGIVLSYLLLLLNTLFSLFVTPYIISCLGAAEYGVYKTMSSFTASLTVLDFGLGSTVMRYVAKYRASNREAEIPNYVAMSLIQAAGIGCIIVLLAIPIYFAIDSVYAGTFSQGQLETAHELFILLIVNLEFSLFENVVNGVITGSNNFVIGNGVKLIRLIIRAILLVTALTFIDNSGIIVIIDIFAVLCVLTFELIFVLVKMKYKVKLTHWDQSVFIDSGKYTLLMLIQNIAIQFNGNVDTILIGAMVSTTSVTIYSMSLTIFNLYENLSSAVTSVLLPSATEIIEREDSPEGLQSWVEKNGRVQFTILAAALGGFIVIGQDFYSLWLGEGYKDCYYLTLILITSTTLPMLNNIALSILRAQNRMGYRTITLVFSSIINVITSVIGIKLLGYWGAAIGTAAYAIANFFMMNQYYRHYMKFDIFSMLKAITSRTIICAIVATVISAVMHNFSSKSWSGVLLQAVVYIAVYGALMLLWGLTAEEKSFFHLRKEKKV